MPSDKIRQAEDYWNQVRSNRAMPSRADINPADIKALLPNVILIEVLWDPLDFRYRLIGTEIDRHSAESYTGKRISEIPERAPPSTVWNNLAGVAETKTPSRASVPYVGPQKDFMATNQIVLPLSTDGERVDGLFLVIDYISQT